MKRICMLTIVFFIVGFGFLSYFQQKDKNEMPMYGGGSFTAEEKSNNDLYVNNMVAFFGTKEAACEQAIATGWLKFFKGRFNVAMRRFNQAWLIDSENPYPFRIA